MGRDVPGASTSAGGMDSESESGAESLTATGGAEVPPGLGGSGGGALGVVVPLASPTGRLREEEEAFLEWCRGGGIIPPTCCW